MVRIGTPCLLQRGRALVPGTVALTPAGLVWDGLWGRSGSYSFEEIRRIETDDRTQARRGFLRSKVLRVTPVRGELVEFVVSTPHAWEWRQALGEWVLARGELRSRDGRGPERSIAGEPAAGFPRTPSS